jgi:RHS repeat-associated protein
MHHDYIGEIQKYKLYFGYTPGQWLQVTEYSSLPEQINLPMPCTYTGKAYYALQPVANCGYIPISNIVELAVEGCAQPFFSNATTVFNISNTQLVGDSYNARVVDLDSAVIASFLHGKGTISWGSACKNSTVDNIKVMRQKDVEDPIAIYDGTDSEGIIDETMPDTQDKYWLESLCEDGTYRVTPELNPDPGRDVGPVFIDPDEYNLILESLGIDPDDLPFIAPSSSSRLAIPTISSHSLISNSSRPISASPTHVDNSSFKNHVSPLFPSSLSPFVISSISQLSQFSPKLLSSSLLDLPTGQFLRFYVWDHLGSTRLIIRALDSGIISSPKYLPFGEEFDPIFADSRFTGKQRDTESNLDYFGARYYSNHLYRWMTPDRLLVDSSPENPQSWNLFIYTRDNPISFIDENGYEITWAEIKDWTKDWTKAQWNKIDSFNSELAEIITTAITTGNRTDNINQNSILKKNVLTEEGFADRLPSAGTISETIIPPTNKTIKSYTKDSIETAEVMAVAELVKVTGKQLKDLRKEFNNMRPEIWKNEANTNPSAYSKENLARMKQGKPPIGPDGKPMEIHHKDPLGCGGNNNCNNLKPLSRRDHREGDNYKKNHPNIIMKEK